MFDDQIREIEENDEVLSGDAAGSRLREIISNPWNEG